MGIFGLAVMIGPAIGPTLGGWITDNYNWPWIFYINVPIGAVGLWMVGRYIHDPAYLTESKAKVRVNGFAIALLTIGLASLQGVLEEGQTMDWFTSNIIIALTVAAVVSLSTFIWWELRTDAPVVDLSVLKSASFTTGTVIGGLLGVSLYSSMFILPLFLQELIGYDATQSGLVLMPRSLVMLVMMPAMGLFYNRIGPRPMIGSGLVVAGVAAIMMSQFTLFTTNAGFLWPQMIQGLGFSLIFVALSTTTLNGIEHRKMTSATGLYNLVRQLGGSFGTAIFATMLETGQQSGRAALVGHIDPFHPAFVYKLQLLEQGLMMRGVDAWTAHLQALKIMEGMVEQQAAVLSFGHAFFLIGVLFFICIPLVFVLKAGGPADGASLSHAAVD